MLLFLCCYCYCILDFGCVCFFFFKQKTAYEMRISDWSSDVWSADLRVGERVSLSPTRHCEEPKGTRQSSAGVNRSGLLRSARNDARVYALRACIRDRTRVV